MLFFANFLNKSIIELFLKLYILLIFRCSNTNTCLAFFFLLIFKTCQLCSPTCLPDGEHDPSAEEDDRGERLEDPVRLQQGRHRGVVRTVDNVS